ncbi:MAG: hypothetical protein WD969_00155 [Paracoccaceae bacterium]
MENAAHLIEAISALLWPLAAICIIIMLLPLIRTVIANREFTLEIGGFKFSAQKATEKIQQQVTDLQNKIVALETAGPAAAREIASFDAPPARALSLVWVDDHPSNNAFETESFRRDGHTVRQVLNTKDALTALRAGGVDAVISDMGRKEDGARNNEAGMTLLRAMRAAGDGTAFAFYTTRPTARYQAGEAKELGTIAMTDSFTSLSSAIKRHFAEAAQTKGA